MVLPLTCKLNLSIKTEIYQALAEKAQSLQKDEDTLIAEALEWYLNPETNKVSSNAPRMALQKRRS
ncbi:MAG: hypothetical protein C7B44_12860 [Sulfobacillus thermosulfidooxidans]|uniref:CopG family transcriptional regulator n=1 Tax=Sulfobacillus thermotolerans TaxID=338644 RepID=A0ABM6RPJ9_9FIRM|nr:hypothetical protein [Sulfobacillus sp. hq2]AUW93338.1 hypothetical protein BXT84_04690 [Sulfobacillus thermotolerans]POB10571.1 hypothetical protein CO251_06935 [Sulfobacillus sp. hq2]PSR35700.1 MAG: hypothetical protein C7B44_12860 [Sulfobacillus thermosulfidooxidans]